MKKAFLIFSLLLCLQAVFCEEAESSPLQDRFVALYPGVDCKLQSDMCWNAKTIKDRQLVGQNLESGASLSTVGARGRTALLLAAEVDSGFAILEDLIEAGSDVNAQDADGMTALMWLTIHEDVDGVESLLQHGARPLIRNNGGLLASDFTQHPDIIELLRKYTTSSGGSDL